ncbi:hypothetical protein EDC04DRAFT_673829 [Pisolithus marmoratus]|nr:hypothetical protein EDC04DRAFT_673829 [Pisolithus marmoratus]
MDGSPNTRSHVSRRTDSISSLVPCDQTIKWADRIASNEGLGVWHVGNYAWKLYATKTEQQEERVQKLIADYQRADIHGVPMGSPRFQNGSIRQGTGLPYDGVALIVQWFEGTYFNFQTPPRPFGTALERQGISHSRSSTDYMRIKAGCQSAFTVGLRDCQGHVSAGAREPVVFIDIHTSWNPLTGQFGYSQQAADLVDIITAWGTQP